MTNKEILQSDMLDIIFEQRNKAYGAYALRRDYPARLAKALVTGIFLMSMIFLLAGRAKKPNKVIAGIPIQDSFATVVLEVLPDKPKPQEIINPPSKPSLPKPPVQQKQFNSIDIVDDNKVDKSVPDIETLKISIISNVDAEGKLVGLSDPPIINNGTGNEIAKPDSVEIKPKVKGLTIAPSFPGGADAIRKFLTRNLRTPDALEAGEKKIVQVKFFVDKEGKVSRFEIIRSGGDEYDKEVIRVLKKMPDWNPGLRNGEPIETHFTQPVTFMGL